MSFGAIKIPVIETERLRLRGFEERDFDAYAEMYSDAENLRFIGGAHPEHEAWRRMVATLGHWALRGFGFFCVAEKATDRFIGQCGPLRPHNWPDDEIGCSFAKEHHGKGYATEAAHASLRFAYEALGWKTAISVIDPENGASQDVARRLGAQKEQANVPIWDFTSDIWRHLPPEQFLQRPAAYPSIA